MKEELGLDHFEGRSWHGLHRHALMTMMHSSNIAGSQK
jgi:SRSO17 transposase